MQGSMRLARESSTVSVLDIVTPLRTCSRNVVKSRIFFPPKSSLGQGLSSLNGPKSCAAVPGNVSLVELESGSVGSGRPLVAPDNAPAEAQLVGVPFIVAEAVSEEELQAAAYLRARTFYTYPDDRSPDAIKAHRQMKAQDDWRALVSKVTGADGSYGRVVCLIALCHISSLNRDVHSDLHSSCKVRHNQVVVGSLDLNRGLRLPGEISGDYPPGPEAAKKRGYLSNVCVAEEVRRKGVAKTMMCHAKHTAQLWGITDLYVHVLFDNLSAQKLYAKAGFQYEKEEPTSSTARWDARPRRLLLRSTLQSS